MTLPPVQDHEIRELLQAIDIHEDITVTTWEADFMEHILFRHVGEWSVKQRATAYKIVGKYRGRL